MATSRTSRDAPHGGPPARPGKGLSVLTLVLALYSAGASTALLFRGPAAPEAASGGAGGASGSDPHSAEEARRVRGEVKEDLEKAIKDVKEQLGRAVKQMEDARDSLKAVEKAGALRTDEVARTASTRVDLLDEKVEDVVKSQASIRATLDGLALAVKELQSRPLVAAAPVKPPEPGTPKPAEPAPAAAEPVGPTPEQIAANKDKVRAAIADLASTDIAKVFPACATLGASGDLEAVPPLLKVLKEFKDFVGRTAAASALGSLHACDAAAGLLAAFLDKDPGVFLASGQAFGRIAGVDTGLAGDATKRERTEARDRWGKWWQTHEPEVRKRWNQEAKAPPEAPPAQPEPGMDAPK